MKFKRLICRECRNKEIREFQDREGIFFIMRHYHNIDGRPDIYVKCLVIQKTDKDEVEEYMWVKVNEIELKYEGYQLDGIIQDTPKKITNYKCGDTIKISTDLISDFMVHGKYFMEMGLEKWCELNKRK